MIVRYAAAVIDAWEALRHPAVALRRAWLAVPAELVARTVLASCGIPPGAGRHVPGAVPGLPGVDAIVVEDPRAARYLDHVPIRPTAQTIGRHIVARRPLSDAILRHELEHVEQWARFGPFFLPAYVLASGVALARRQDRYWGNAFEVTARAREVVTEAAAGSGTGGGE